MGATGSKGASGKAGSGAPSIEGRQIARKANKEDLFTIATYRLLAGKSHLHAGYCVLARLFPLLRIGCMRMRTRCIICLCTVQWGVPLLARMTRPCRCRREHLVRQRLSVLAEEGQKSKAVAPAAAGGAADAGRQRGVPAERGCRLLSGAQKATWTLSFLFHILIST